MSTAALKTRTREAIQELREMRCADPAGTDALDAIRLSVHTLEQWWLPELSRLTSSV